jgi:protein gp37
MNHTSIEWTDFSANPLKFRDESGRVVWGCVHASPGCQHCYAETLAKRYGKGGPFNVPTTAKLTPFLDESELRRMLTYKPASGKRCFVGDMTDIFGEWVPDELLIRLFDVFRQRTDITFQVLTKRADRMRDFARRLLFDGSGKGRTWLSMPGDDRGYPLFPQRGATGMRNVWLGVSVEGQQRAAERIPLLLQTPAALRFISAEPLLGPIDLGPFVTEIEPPSPPILDWVIVGGESGSGARPCHLDWVRSLVRQCSAAGVPVFVKQLGSDARGVCAWPHHDEYPPEIIDDDGVLTSVSGRPGTLCHAIDDYWWPCRLKTKSRKGGDPAEWPNDLRLREFPQSAVLA